MREVRNVSVVLSAKIDRYKADMALAGRTAVDQANKIETAWDKSSTGVGKAMRSVEKYHQEMTQVGSMMAGFGGVVVGSLGLATRATMKWESAWTGVMKTVDGTPKQLSEIETGLRDLAKTLPATHEEIAGVAEAAGQLGVKTKDVVSFTKTMIDLGESTNLTAEEASTSIAQIANVMGTTGSEISRFGSTLVELGNNGASTEKDILEMSQRLSGAGKLAGATESDVLALSNAMASVGIRAELGGGVMSRVMNKMYEDVKTGGEGLENLASVAGVSSKQFAQAFESDPVRAVDMITKGLNGVKESGGNVVQTLGDIGVKGTGETQVMLQLAGAGDLLSDSLDMGKEAWEQNSALAIEASKRYETAESKIKIAGNQIKDTAITLGGTFAPAVAAVVGGVGDMVETVGKAPKPVLQLGGALGGLVGSAALVGGGFLLLAPKIAETISAVNTLRTKSEALDGMMTKLGNNGKTSKMLIGVSKAAGLVAAGFAAAQLAGTAFTAMMDTSSRSSEEMINKLTLLDEATTANTKGSLLDPSIWEEANSFWVKGIGTDGIETWGDALERSGDKVTAWGDKMLNTRSDVTIVNETIAETDTALSSLADSGSFDKAVAGFQAIAEQSPNMLPEDVLKKFPTFRDHLAEVATNAGMVADDATLTGLAMGEIKVPADAAAGAVSGVGDAAGDAATNLRDMFDGLVELGLANLSEREAMRQFEESIDAVNEAIKENGKSLDITTEKGRANQEVLDGIARDGIGAADAMIEHGKSQEDVQEQLQRTYDELVTAGKGFTGSGKKARQMARDILEIPDGVSVESWMDDAARKEAKDTGDEIEAVGQMKPKPKIDADTKSANDKLDAVKTKVGKMPKQKTIWVTIKEAWEDMWKPDKKSKSTGGGRKGVEKRAKMLDDPFGPKYFGGIDLKPMAAGGVVSNNIAEMVKPNTWRIVGDRMDVDEAFIPLDGSQRSWKIMMQALSRMPGSMPMARGGITSAQSAVDAAQDKLRAARREKYDAKSKKAKNQAERRVRIAEDELESSKKALKAAKERQKAEERAAKLAADRAKEERERRQRVNELRSDTRTDLRRGDIRESVTGSLSGGYGVVDELFGLGKNQDLSRGSRSKATSKARKFESSLRSLYAQAEKLDSRLEAAQKKADELNGIKSSVASSLLGDRSLDMGMTSQRGANGKWTTTSNLGQAAKSMKMDVGAMKSFAGKLKKLAEMGIPGAIIQQIAQAGVDEGSSMADSFLKASSAERKSYVGAWKDYEKYANQAGEYVTRGFSKGGAEAANGVVKGIKGKQKSVETAIANLAKAMERTFKDVLGIHSPSRVTGEIGEFTVEGLVQSMLAGRSTVQAAAASLASAAVPSVGPMPVLDPISAPTTMDIGINPVVQDDEGAAGLAMQNMSSTTLDAMSQMNSAVSEGFAGMISNTQAAQSQMLLDTQLNQTGMLTATQGSNAGQLLDTQTQQAAMLLNTQTQNASMLLDVQTQQEAMRHSVAAKQSAAKTAATEQQEAMRLMLIEKQSSMKTKSETDFESMKRTTGSKFGEMRKATDTTMSNTYDDYDSRLVDMKSLNKRGFESILGTSNTNMEGVRKGINREIEDAKPQLGSRMNSLIDVMGSFSSSINKAFGDVGVKLPAPAKLKYADGGMLPGYSPGYDDYRFMDPAGRSLELSGGESIMRPEFGAVVGPHWVEGANAAARAGGIEGVRQYLDMPHEAFARGGTLSFKDGGTLPRTTAGLVQLGKALSGIGVRVSEGPAPFGPVHRVHAPNSWHYRQGALDLNTAPGQSAKEMRDFDQIMPLLHQLGWGVIWRYAGHYNHAHVDLGNRSLGSFNRNAQGSGDLWQKLLGLRVNGGGAGGMDFHPFLDKAGISPGADMSESYERAAKKLLKSIVAKHEGMLPDGMAGDLGAGIMAKAQEGLVKKAAEYGKTAGAGGADFSNVANGPIKQMAKQMLEAMGWGDQFGDLNWLLTRESGWNPNAQNPTSTAYGLFQFLNSTWGSVGGSKTSDPRLQLEYGLKYIKQRYGDVRGARSFWQRNHWYEGGIRAAQSGLAVVGENGPELVDLRGSERIHNAQQTRKLLAENRTMIPAPQQSSLSAQQLGKAIAAAGGSNGGITPQDLAAAFDGVKMTFQAEGQQFSGAVTAVIANGYDQSRSRLAKSSQKVGAIR